MCLREVAIVGNGPGVIPATRLAIPVVRFNAPAGEPPGPLEVMVRNARRSGNADTNGLTVESGFLEPAAVADFATRVGRSAAWLETRLGCAPSTGLAVVYALSAMADSVQIYRMPLNPSLARSPGIPARKPLPCAFHNWLGEHRVAIELLRLTVGNKLRWYELSPCRPAGQLHMDGPFTKLLACFSAAVDRRREDVLADLAVLQRISPESWYSDYVPERMVEIESYFYLDRSSSETKNWWLFDMAGSACIDQIQKALIWCMHRRASISGTVRIGREGGPFPARASP